MKRIVCFALFLLMLLAAACAFAAGNVPPEYKAEKLSQKELAAFFTDEGEFGEHAFQPARRIANEIYKHLTNKDETVYGMRFTALDKEEDVDPDYGDDIADFTIETNHPVKVILAGNYNGLLFGDFGTIVLPAIFEVKPGERFRVMETLGLHMSYLEVVKEVGVFECVAILVTDELHDAIRTIMGKADKGDYGSMKPEDIDGLKQYGGDILAIEDTAPEDTKITLTLNLFDPDNEERITMNGKPVDFCYRPALPAPKPEVIAALPRTGDASSLMLWTALLCMAAAGAALLRSRKAA